jgi:hypothetical protein
VAHLLVALVFAACTAPAALADTARRVALVIGNATYASAPTLANPRTDAKLIADALKHAGFTDITLALDLSKDAFEDSLKKFRRSADGAEVALLYYAGHGLEINGRNWLIPVDARLDDERDLPFQAIDLDVVLDTVVGAKGLRVVVLDACRDNPFTRSIRQRSGTRGLADRGLADIEVSGTLVLYAQRAGATALDGSGGDSPFAIALARRLPEPGTDIRILVSQVRDDVLAMTGNKQEPFSYGSLPGISLELVPKSGGSSPPPDGDPDLAAFNQATTANSVAGWNSYLKLHPDGRYAHIAQAERDRLASQQAQPSPQSSIQTSSLQSAPPTNATASTDTQGVDVFSQGRAALTACKPPGSVRVPRGANASRAEMLAAHSKIQAFDAATARYDDCLKQAMSSFKSQYAGTAPAEVMKKLEALQVDLNNQSVDRDKAVADDFNEQLRIFKATQ